MAEVKSLDEDIVVLLNWLAQSIDMERGRQILYLAANEIVRLRGANCIPSHGANWRSSLTKDH